MHINMKYYIVTISAIFISLGIGILVGFNINDNQLLNDQQSGMIVSLEEQFDEFQEINNLLEDELDLIKGNYYNALEFITLNLDSIIANRLVDKNIGIISTNEQNEYAKNLNSLVTNSGANVSFDIIILDNIIDENKIKEISEAQEVELENTSELISYIVQLLNNEMNKEKIDELANMGIIEINYLAEEYNKYNEVVLAGGNEIEGESNLFEDIDLNLINELKESKKSIVGIQQSTSKTNYSDLYFGQGISTVDNVESNLGKISLVLLLQDSDLSGQFGMLENAQSIIPYNATSEEN